MTDAFVQISRQEGVKALYSGYDSSNFSLVIHIMDSDSEQILR